MRFFWKALALLAGLAMLGWYLSHADWHSVGEALRRLGWLTPLALVPYVLVYVVDCTGWRLCLPSRLKLPFPSLFCIRWAGESVNSLVPSGYLGGEAVKVYLLRKKGVPPEVGTSAAVVSKTAQSIAQLLCLMLAAGLFLQTGNIQPGLRAGMLTILCAGFMLVLAFFWIQRRGLFTSLESLAGAFRLNLAFLAQHREKLLTVDRDIAGFYREHRSRFFASGGIYFCGWLMDAMEIFFVSYLLGMPISWTQALVVESFTVVVKLLGFWVPGALGVQESGILMLGRMAGLPDTLSTAYPLLRRAREIIFALVGLLLLYANHAGLKTIRAEPAASTAALPQD